MDYPYGEIGPLVSCDDSYQTDNTDSMFSSEEAKIVEKHRAALMSNDQSKVNSAGMEHELSLSEVYTFITVIYYFLI